MANIALIVNNILSDSGAEIGAANGVATLDSGGKIPVSQLPNSVMEFKGTWSAATNTPTLANGTGNAGDVYEVSAAGTVNFGAGGIAFALGDYVVYDGTSWQYSSGQKGTVTSLTFSAPLSGGTITTSGTVSIPAATSSVDGYLKATDWVIFNGKQNALTNPVTGTGTANYLPKFTGASTLGNSNLQTDASGNLGLGVTPSAWMSSFTALQLQDANIFSYSSNAGLQFTTNAYYNSGFKYQRTAGATYYVMAPDSHQWHVAPSGTAGAAVTFAQAMTLFANGNLAIGTTSDAGYKLDVNGTLRAVSGASPSVFNTSTGQGIAIENSGSSNKRYRLNVDGTSFLITEAGVGTPLTIAAGGAATFSSSVTVNARTSNLALRMQYPDDPNYRLDINQIVTSGLVKHSFNVVNAGTSYNNNLVLDRGSVGIGTTSPALNAKLTVMGNQTFGLPGTGANANGRYLSIEGNTDVDGEGSGRIFFTEHNGTSAAMDSYGMSLGYRGGGTSIVGASGNTWTGLSLIGNGEWGMWGHNGDDTGALIMYGDRAATFINLANNSLNNVNNAYFNGSVGIGIESTGPKLQISGTHTGGRGIVEIQSTNDTLIALRKGGGTSGLRFQTAASADNWFFGEDNSGNIILQEDFTTTRFTMFQGGNFVIGNGADAGYKLDVSGTGRFSGAVYVSIPSYTMPALTPSYFGYSSSYNVLILGNTNGAQTRSLAFGVDVSGNTSGAFSGYGSEYIWRNTGSFITPNASNNSYNTLFSWNSSGQLSLAGVTTIAELNVNSGLRIGDYSGNPALTFAAANNGFSKINFYDQNSTEGLYLRTDGEQYGGTMTFGARWDDDEAKIVFKMYQSSAGAGYNARVGIGTTDPAGELTVKRGYASNATPLYVGNTSYTAWNRQAYDTFVLQQDDVTSFRMVEKNGETTASDQVLTFAVGDGYARIASSAVPLQFFVNGSPSAFAYTGLSGTLALSIATSGNIGVGMSSPSSKLVVYKGVSGGIIGKVSDTALTIDSQDYGISTWNAQIGFGYSANFGFTYNPVSIAFIPTYAAGAGYADLAFYTRAVSTDTAPSERMRITSTGQVGISNTSPNITGLTGTNYTVLTISGKNAGYPGVIELQMPSYASTSGDMGWIDFFNGSNNNVRIYANPDGSNTDSGKLLFFTRATGGSLSERMRITSSGNILINRTSDLGYKLQVNGTNGSIAVTGSGYVINPVPMLIGQYASDIGYIQVPNQGRIDIWNGGSGAIATFYNNSNSQFNGNVSIGTSTANGRLQVTGSHTSGYGMINMNSSDSCLISMDSSTSYDVRIRYKYQGTDIWFWGMTSNNVMRLTDSGNNDRFTVTTAGAGTFSSSVTATAFFESSDKTIKTLIQDNYQTKGIESVTAKLYIKNGKEELGYYAQDLQDILPSAVSKGTDGLLSLSYREVHTAKIARLEKRVEELEQLLNLN